MPNTTPESDSLKEVKRMILQALSDSERSRLRPWLLAKFGVDGKPQAALDDVGSK